jgi:hypothetical protein
MKASSESGLWAIRMVVVVVWVVMAREGIRIEDGRAPGRGRPAAASADDLPTPLG